MRYVYSTVRFVPDPGRGEFVNVGLIAGSDETGEWELRLVENPKRASRIDDHRVLGQVWTHLTGLARTLDEFSVAQEESRSAGVEISEGWLDRLTQQSQRIVQFSAPAPIVANSVAEVF